jgi:pilus assembly protein CpaF
MSVPIVVVVGAKGGCGATTLACETARRLRKQLGGEVAIVDADFTGRRSVAIVLDAVKALDAVRTQGTVSIAPLEDGLLAVELAPSREASFMLGPERVEELRDELSRTTRAIVIDAPQPYPVIVRPFLTQASQVVVVTEPTMLGAAALRTMQIGLTRFGFDANDVVTAVVQRDPRPELGTAEFQRLLGVTLAGEIANKNDRRFTKSLDAFATRLASLQPLEADRRLAPSSRGSSGAANAPQNDDAPAGQQAPKPQQGSTPARDTAELDEIKSKVHAQLAERLDVAQASRATSDGEQMARLRAQIDSIVDSIVIASPIAASAEDLAQLRQDVIDETLGYGPLEDLMRDPEVSEIMVNGSKKIFVERRGKLTKTSKQFADDAQLRLVIERMTAPIGRRIDESQPMVDGRLPDGSRINAVIEPLALAGPTLTIRRFSKRRLQAEDLIRFGAVSAEVVDFLRAAVQARLNIIISGGTGSGKTTFLNMLSSFLPEDERIVTIEDAAELSLAQEHVVQLEARPANIQGTGEIRIRDLLRNALRMRPDRIIVGECRGGEALDMLQAMNTGHDGSLTTVHANTQRDAMSRIETMVMMAGFDLPIRAIREQIAGALDIVIQLSRMRDGSRKVVGVSEVVGMEGDVVTMQEIVRFDQRGVDATGKVRGEFVFTGVQPHALAKFEEYGVAFDPRTFSGAQDLVATW